jgi:hypothetical protein
MSSKSANCNGSSGFAASRSSSSTASSAPSAVSACICSKDDKYGKASRSWYLYGHAATVLGPDAVRNIARRVDASIRRAAGLNADLVAPDIELQVRADGAFEPNRFDIAERAGKPKSFKDTLDRLSESNEVYQARQQKNYDAFGEFRITLTHAKAQIILDRLGLEDFEAIVSADPALASQWHALFLELAEARLPAIHNLILLLAHAMAGQDPAKARALFARVRLSQPLVRFTYGAAAVPLDAMAAWAGHRNPILNAIRFARLSAAATDQELASEVLAAHRSGQQVLLEEYIELLLRHAEPADVARALMVAGFSDRSTFNDQILARFEGASGMIATALTAAKHAYQRNIWSRHWYGEMLKATDGEAFWLAAVLLTKIVDGRLCLWRRKLGAAGDVMDRFAPSLKQEVMRRFKRWGDKRKKTLFGQEAPPPVFLSSIRLTDALSVSPDEAVLVGGEEQR